METHPLKGDGRSSICSPWASLGTITNWLLDRSCRQPTDQLLLD
jgi:hypothetical protein